MKATLLLAAACVLAGPALAADLVVNGSFETPDVSTAPGHINRPIGAVLPVSPGAPLVTGWQAFSAPVHLTRTPFNEGWETLLAGDGAQAMDLTGETVNGQGGVEQAVATAPGRDYVLTFQLGMYAGSPVYSGPVRVRVTAGSVTHEFLHDAPTPVPGGNWQTFALPFRASAAFTTVRFQSLVANSWCALDRVALADAHLPSPPAGLRIPSWTANGPGATTSASADGRYGLSATIGQPDAQLLAGGALKLAGGFMYPGHTLRVARQDAYARVSWDFGLGTAAELQSTEAFASTPAATVWTPVSLAGNASGVLFPLIGQARFFRVRED
jgi:Protein of unknown function (DUF642)